MFLFSYFLRSEQLRKGRVILASAWGGEKLREKKLITERTRSTDCRCGECNGEVGGGGGGGGKGFTRRRWRWGKSSKQSRCITAEAGSHLILPSVFLLLLLLLLNFKIVRHFIVCCFVSEHPPSPRTPPSVVVFFLFFFLPLTSSSQLQFADLTNCWKILFEEITGRREEPSRRRRLKIVGPSRSDGAA